MAERVTIGELGRHVGAEVLLRGWLCGTRSSGKIMFLLVRDGTGVCQCLVEASAPEAFAAAQALNLECSLRLSGLVRSDARAPGGVEVAVGSIEPIQGEAGYPITRKPHGVEFLMNHRHLWLRSRRQAAILRIRHTLIRAVRGFLDGLGFTLVDTPIIIGGAAEGAGTLFPLDFFGEQAFLAQTGQLYLECACMSLGKVYCFGPAFRAEKSKTRRHLAEFWMVEPEIAFAELDEVMDLAEDLTCRAVKAVLDGHREDLAFLGRDIAPLERVAKPFPRITYTDAVEMLRSPDTAVMLERELEADRSRLQAMIAELAAMEDRRKSLKKQAQMDELDLKICALRERIRELEQDVGARPGHIALAREFEWGKDLGGSDETILSRRFDRPFFVTEYPRQAKAFYMKRSAADGRVVRNMDLLAPEGYGEIAGGSQREDDLAALEARMREEGLDPARYGWYLDLRRYGSVPHGGFGMGIERTLAWLCGLKHVRETIPFPRMMGRMAP